MSEDVRIVARFDDSDIQNGVVRSEKAARDMKQVWESTRWVSPSGPGANPPVGDTWKSFGPQAAAPKLPEDQNQSGLLNGLIGRLLIRDAIYSFIRVMVDAFKESLQRISELVGLNIKINFTKALGDAFADAFISLVPYLKKAVTDQAERAISQIDDDEKFRKEMLAYENNPEAFKETPSQVRSKIEGLYEEQAEAEKEHQQFIISKANKESSRAAAFQSASKYLPGMSLLAFEANTTASLSGNDNAGMNDELFAQSKEDSARQMKRLTEELRISEMGEAQRKKQSSEMARDDMNSSDDAIISKAESGVPLTAKEFDRYSRIVEKQNRDKEELLRKSSEAIAKAKRLAIRERSLEDREQLLGDSTKTPQSELLSLERSIHEAHATSAVRINGGVFGRNDSMGALVIKADRQIGLLSSIAGDIKAVRADLANNQRESALI